jgi:hypothetical protein
MCKKIKLRDSFHIPRILNIKLSLGERQMNTDLDTVSGWFTLNAGFKVYGRCPACSSPRIAYYAKRHPGLKGISVNSKGITPACLDCGKSLPIQKRQEEKNSKRIAKIISTRF